MFQSQMTVCSYKTTFKTIRWPDTKRKKLLNCEIQIEGVLIKQ